MNDSALAEKLLQEYLAGGKKSEIERRVWGDGSSHGKRFDRFIVEQTGKLPQEHKPRPERRTPKLKPDPLNPCWICNNEVDLSERPYAQKIVGGVVIVRAGGGTNAVHEAERVEIFAHHECFQWHLHITKGE